MRGKDKEHIGGRQRLTVEAKNSKASAWRLRCVFRGVRGCADTSFTEMGGMKHSTNLVTGISVEDFQMYEIPLFSGRFVHLPLTIGAPQRG